MSRDVDAASARLTRSAGDAPAAGPHPHTLRKGSGDLADAPRASRGKDAVLPHGPSRHAGSGGHISRISHATVRFRG